MNYLIYSNRGGGDYDKKEDLTVDIMRERNPDYVFFPFWSWIIQAEIYLFCECIGFHMTDLPFGRGGSPLQNLIIRGHKTTKISAFRIGEGLDTGDIYLKRDFDISYGSADQIYDRALKIILEDMIPYIVNNNPVPVPQTGKVVEFQRWKNSNIYADFCRLGIPGNPFDFIRMLDTDYEGIKRAHINIEGHIHEVRVEAV